MRDVIQSVGNEIADMYIRTTNQVILLLARNQIKLAFDQAEKEVFDLQQRTREGMAIAKVNGKRVGTQKGDKIITKKSIAAKEIIKNPSKDFGGSLKGVECIKLCSISRKTYYKYKKTTFNGA